MAALGAGTDSGGQGGSPLSEQDSGILDVEDEEEDDDVRKLQHHTRTQTHESNKAAGDLLSLSFLSAPLKCVYQKTFQGFLFVPLQTSGVGGDVSETRGGDAASV